MFPNLNPKSANPVRYEQVQLIMSESFAELFEQSQIEAKMRPGTIVSGQVVDVSNDKVIVNAGLKSEGVIPNRTIF